MRDISQNYLEKRNRGWVYEYSRIREGGGKTGGSDGSRESNLYADKITAFAGVDATENRIFGNQEGGQNAVCGRTLLLIYVL